MFIHNAYASCTQCMEPIRKWLEHQQTPYKSTDNVKTLSANISKKKQEEMHKALSEEGITLSFYSENPQNNHQNQSLYAALLNGIAGGTLMALMLAGVSISWPVLLAIGLSSLILAIATSHQWFRELWQQTKKGQVSVNGFFAICIIAVWACAMTSLIMPSFGAFIGFDMVLMLPAIRHLGIWIKALAYKKTHKPWQWPKALLQNYPTAPKAKSDYEACEGLVPVDSRCDSNICVNLLHHNGQDEWVQLPAHALIPQGAIIAKPLVLKAVNCFEESSIMQLLTNSKSQVSELEETLGRWLNRYLRLVLMIAITVGTIWACLNPGIALFSSLAVLLVSCPCTLGMGIEMLLKTTQNIALQRGIVFKHLDGILSLAGSQSIWLDKTGTLTELAFKASTGNQQLLTCIQANIQKSMPNNPYAHAYMLAHPKSPQPQESIEITDTHGGISLKYHDKNYRLEADPITPQTADRTRTYRLFYDSRHQAIASMTFEESLKPETKASLQMLRRLFNQTHLITGSKEAHPVEKTLLSGRVYCNASPENKKGYLEEDTTKATMLGDALNDLPAQQAAYCSLGYRQDISETDITLLQSSPWSVVLAKTMATSCRRAIRALVSLSFLYNLAAITLAAGGFFLLTATPLSPMVAALMMLSSFMIIPLTTLLLKINHHHHLNQLETWRARFNKAPPTMLTPKPKSLQTDDPTPTIQNSSNEIKAHQAFI